MKRRKAATDTAAPPATAAGRTTDGSRRRVVLQAIGLMLLAGVCSSLLHIGVKTVSPKLPTIEIVFLRSVFTLVITLPFVLRGADQPWRSNRFDLQALRGLIGVTSMASWYYALGQMPLADAGVMSFTTPIFITLGAALYFKEKVGLRRWTGVLVGLLGALVVLRPGSGVVSWPAVAAVGSSVLWASSLLMAKHLARYDSTLTIAFYQPVMIAPFALVGTIPLWVTPDLQTWLILLGMGVVAAVGNYCYIHALRIADASLTMPADYVRLVWMAGWGYFVFAEVPGAQTWVGAALIVGSTLYITWRESRLAARKKS